MQRNFYTLLIALFLAPCFMAAQNVLYIARNNPADGNDPVVIQALTDMGYNVTTIGAGDLSVTSHIDNSADMMFFGEYLSSSGVVPFADAGFPVPCVSLEGYCPRGNRWALLASDDDFGQIREDGDNSLSLTPVIPDHYSNTVTADHPIFNNAGLYSGDTFAWSTEGTALPEVVWFDLPQAGATSLATINEGSAVLNTFWIMEPDAADATNPLNHRLVIWGVHDNGFAAATPEFWAVLDNSVQWVLGDLSSTKDTDILAADLSNNPNPFSTTTQITFNLKEAAEMELRVFDAFGRTVSSTQEFFTAGEQQMTYTNDGLAAGVYFYSLYADGLFAGTGKMMVK